MPKKIKKPMKPKPTGKRYAMLAAVVVALVFAGGVLHAHAQAITVAELFAEQATLGVALSGIPGEPGSGGAPIGGTRLSPSPVVVAPAPMPTDKGKAGLLEAIVGLVVMVLTTFAAKWTKQYKDKALEKAVAESRAATSAGKTDDYGRHVTRMATVTAAHAAPHLVTFLPKAGALAKAKGDGAAWRALFDEYFEAVWSDLRGYLETSAGEELTDHFLKSIKADGIEAIKAHVKGELAQGWMTALLKVGINWVDARIGDTGKN